ncbi:zinc-finger homeodomain protein 4-like [Solanum pennellii]|uniref:Zinc-finger homeodomain protein 4-like n=1 Tax=Solanum pennellii TaxID=28526 RepID=A0ABM1FCA6_SOLPN|nr:zinc-finger homeodomain protein 4-like [Solanum pennellii]
MASNNNKYFLVKYLECRHNYAARSNGYVLDGCGEFCPTGALKTLESFICAACHCHRNFHRKVEVELEDGVESPIISIDHPSRGTPLVIIDDPPPQYTVKSRAQFCETSKKNNIDEETKMKRDGGEIKVRKLKRKYNASSSKRMRLNPYQRERIWIFANEIMRWKWTKSNEQVIPFCDEIGITPKFLKNWINNTKSRTRPLAKNEHVRNKN